MAADLGDTDLARDKEDSCASLASFVFLEGFGTFGGLKGYHTQ